MTLATHTIVGTLIASLVPSHAVLAFGAAMASHFAVDAVPHWDYSLFSAVRDRKDPLKDGFAFDRRFARDLFRISFDAAIGVAASAILLVWLRENALPGVFIGAAGGILPDALQVAYAKWRHEPLVSLQRFHLWIQKGRQLAVGPSFGIALQIFFVAVLVLCRFALAS